MKSLFKALIKIYALAVSPFLGRNCRFQPTCSNYAQQAIDKYGAVKGSWIAIKRISKCHPWNKGDPLDPVP